MVAAALPGQVFRLSRWSHPMSRVFLAAAVAAGLVALPAAAAQDHALHAGHSDALSASDNPAASGQAAFAALSDAVARLEADPATDWSKADLGALRAHLVDMDDVFLRAQARTTPIPGGARFEVTGPGRVAGAIQRMTRSHSAMADGEAGRRFTVTPTADGAIVTVTAADPEQEQKIRALGFFGLLASGAHHQSHHLMLARGAPMAP
jgi:hypothetical protein